MAEFCEVVKEYRRMIRHWRDSDALSEEEINKAIVKFEELSDTAAASFEHYIMDWAAIHPPKKKYPKWANYLHSIGVLGKYLPHEAGFCIYHDLASKEIPEHIAKKNLALSRWRNNA